MILFPKLTTERLLLRQVQPGDQAFIFEGLSHPDVIVHYGVQFHSYEGTKEQMDWYETIWKDGKGISWIIVEKATGEMIGNVCVYDYQPDHNKAEVGIWLLPRYWKRGFALEALLCAINYWQMDKEVHRLEAFVEQGNLRSAMLLEKAGFLYEGTMRDCERKNGKYISLMVYALVK